MAGKPGKIKILYTIPNFDTAGGGKALLKIASRLDRKKFLPEIMCMHDHGTLFMKVENSGIQAHIYQYTTPMIPRIRGLKNCWRISRHLKSINPDIIHSFHYAPDYSEALAAKFAGVPWVYTKKNMNWGGKSTNSWRLRVFLSKGIVIQNKDMQKLPFPRKKTKLIYRGVDTEEFKISIDNKIEKYRKGIPYDSKVILTVANLVPVKRTELLLETFDKIDNKNSNVYLLIVGEYSSVYGSELFRKYSHNSKILFTGKQMDIAKYYSIADVFVLPSKQEGCPVALLEAMASGVPSIGYDVPGIRDVILKDLMITDNSTLEEKIQWLLNVPKAHKRNIQKDQLKIIEKSHLLQKEVTEHEKFYSQILQ